MDTPQKPSEAELHLDGLRKALAMGESNLYDRAFNSGGEDFLELVSYLFNKYEFKVDDPGWDDYTEGQQDAIGDIIAWLEARLPNG